MAPMPSFSPDVHGFRALLHVDGNPVVSGFDDGAGFGQFVQYDFHGFRCGIAQDDFAAGHGDGAEEGTGFDTVGNDAVFAAVQLFYAFDGHGCCTDAADFRAHFDEAFRQIDDFGFDGAVFEDGRAFGEGCRHQQVFRTADGNDVHDDARAFQTAFGFDVTVFDGDLRTHGFEAFEVLVDRARTDGAAAGQADLGFAETRQRRAEHEDGGTHGFHQFVGGAGVVDGAAVDFEFVNVVGQNARAHALQQFLGGFDVGEHGYVFQA